MLASVAPNSRLTNKPEVDGALTPTAFSNSDSFYGYLSTAALLGGGGCPGCPGASTFGKASP